MRRKAKEKGKGGHHRDRWKERTARRRFQVGTGAARPVLTKECSRRLTIEQRGANGRPERVNWAGKGPGLADASRYAINLPTAFISGHKAPRGN